MKEGSNPCYVPSRRVAYALQKPLKVELEWLQKQQIIVPLGVDEMLEWYNSFVLVTKANGRVTLCPDLTQRKH